MCAIQLPDCEGCWVVSSLALESLGHQVPNLMTQDPEVIEAQTAIVDISMLNHSYINEHRSRLEAYRQKA